MSRFEELLAPYRGLLPPLSELQIDRLAHHFDLLLQWNKRLNLSSVREEAEIVERHYCESLFLAARLPDAAARIADLGSGAGFPGIPVAVLHPASQVFLIESHQRKSVFLREAVRDIGNASVIAGRAEEVTQVFDIVVSRAVNLEDLERWLLNHARAIAPLSGADRPDIHGVTWDASLRLPWGDRRFLNMGVIVSRETSEHTADPNVSLET